NIARSERPRRLGRRTRYSRSSDVAFSPNPKTVHRMLTCIASMTICLISIYCFPLIQSRRRENHKDTKIRKNLCVFVSLCLCVFVVLSSCHFSILADQLLQLRKH